MFKATPHKDRLTALRVPCLHLFRHIAQKFLDIRQYACEISIQSDEKSDGAIRTQSLCGIALKLSFRFSLGGFFRYLLENAFGDFVYRRLKNRSRIVDFALLACYAVRLIFIVKTVDNLLN